MTRWEARREGITMGLEADLFGGTYTGTAGGGTRPYRCRVEEHANGPVIVHVWTDTGNLGLDSMCSCGEREWLALAREDEEEEYGDLEVKVTRVESRGGLIYHIG